MPHWIIQYWIEIVFGVIVFIFSASFKKLKSKVKGTIEEQSAVKLGIQALLRDRMIQAYNKANEQGFAPIYLRENMEQMYAQYHNLGGNGTVTDLMEKMKDLPTQRGSG